MTNLNVEIVTPDGIVFTGDLKACTAPGASGQFQILSGHAPYLANLQIGEIKILNNDGQKILATSGGFLEVQDNIISIIVESAEYADGINIDRAKEAEKKARKRLEEKGDIDFKRADFALLRALNRLKVSSYK
jgi:F-type H+-transporting ATPase subunit epsilon